MEKWSLDVLKDMAINVKYTAKLILKLAYQLNKVASNYDNIEIHCKIMEAANLLNSEAATALHLNEKLTDTKEAVNVFKQWSLQSWHSIKELFEFNDICSENNKSSENLKDIAKLAKSSGIVITIRFGNHVSYDGFFAV